MMDYDSYYPAQTGQPPPPVPTMLNNNQLDCNMMCNPMMPTNGHSMMYPPAPSTPQNMRHTPGPPPMPPQQQHQPPPPPTISQQHHQQHAGHPVSYQQPPPPHAGYHQLPSHPPMSHPNHHHQVPVRPPPPPAPISHSAYPHPHPHHIPQTEFRMLELNKRLQSRPRVGGLDEANWWERFVCEFFADDSSLTWRIPGEDKPLEYKISRTLIPRFFRSYFEGGVTDLSIKLRNIKETSHDPSYVTLDLDQADMITKHITKQPGTNYWTNVVVHTEGHLSIDFCNTNFDQLLIKSWRFYANNCHEYIDRSMTNAGLTNNYLVGPVTRFGLTKLTSSYLRMCMVMQPMQDLMTYHIQSHLDPKSCLKHILIDRYKIENVAPQPNKRRKRKTPAGLAAPRASPLSKKSKLNSANDISGPPIQPPPMSLSQDVLVVGEPSMLGAEFGDENERRITRLENTMNGETNHIAKSEMDLQQQEQQQNVDSMPEVSRDSSC